MNRKRRGETEEQDRIGYPKGKGATAKWNGRKELQHNGTGDRIGQRIEWNREQQNGRGGSRMVRLTGRDCKV